MVELGGFMPNYPDTQNAFNSANFSTGHSANTPGPTTTVSSPGGVVLPGDNVQVQGGILVTEVADTPKPRMDRPQAPQHVSTGV